MNDNTGYYIFFVAYTIIWLLFIIFIVSSVITQYIANYKLLKFIRFKNPWAVFIPFYSGYAYASICRRDAYNKVDIEGIKIDGDLFNYWQIIQMLCAIIPFLGSFCSMIISISAMYKFYATAYSYIENLTENSQDIKLKAVLSVFLPYASIVFVSKYNKYTIDNNYNREFDYYMGQNNYKDMY